MRVEQSRSNGEGLSRQAQVTKVQSSQTIERIAFKIEAGEPSEGWVKVTPGMAQEILARFNQNNRPFRDSRAKKYGRQIATGQWRRTSVPVLFSESGKLLDGQHRLGAVIEAGKPAEFKFVYGEPDENFAFIDLNGGRNASDIFSIYGVKNAPFAAAITRFVCAHRAGRLSGRAGVPFFSFDNPDAQYRAYLELGPEKVQKSSHVAVGFGGRRLPYPTVMGSLHYLFSEKTTKKADEFFEGLKTGDVPNPRTNPIFKLRDRLLSEKLERISAAGDTIQAWNAWRTGKSIGQWYSKKGGKIPAIM